MAISKTMITTNIYNNIEASCIRNHSFEKKMHQSPAATIKKRKRKAQHKVAFREENNIYVECSPNNVLIDSNCISNDQLWWTREDLGRNKLLIKKIGYAIRKNRRKNKRICPLAMGHHKTKLVLKSDFRRLVKLPLTTPDQDLQRWCAHDDGRRGLERIASKEYHASQLKDHVDIQKMVSEEQKLQRKLNMYNPERIANICKEISKRSRTFANYMGEADAKISSSNFTKKNIFSNRPTLTNFRTYTRE